MDEDDRNEVIGACRGGGGGGGGDEDVWRRGNGGMDALTLT